MSTAEPKWQSHLYAILSHPSEPSMLMVSEKDGWSLPHVCIDERVWLADFGRINEAMQQQLGRQVTVLRYVSYLVDKSKRQAEAIFVLDNQLVEVETIGGEWIKHEILASLPLALPSQRSAIEGYLAEIEEGKVPQLRPPWARPGWFREAEVWIGQQLSRLGYTLVAPVEYVKSWGISCILRARTSAGDIYFKEATILPLFADEPSVTTVLARLFPDHVPVPLCIERKRRWMLLADFGQSVEQLGEDVPRGEIFCLYAQLQIASAEHVDHLLAAGCLDRRLDRLSAQIDPLLKDIPGLSSVKAEEIQKIPSLAPTLKEICSKLASYRVPETVVHGDLQMDNVALHEGKVLFFDWTDSCISHPFLDMFSIFFDEKNAQVRTNLRDEYLASWTRFEPTERLAEAWALAEPLCALHHMVSYQHIIANLEPTARQEFGGALPRLFKNLLQSLEKLQLINS